MSFYEAFALTYCIYYYLGDKDLEQQFVGGLHLEYMLLLPFAMRYSYKFLMIEMKEMKGQTSTQIVCGENLTPESIKYTKAPTREWLVVFRDDAMVLWQSLNNDTVMALMKRPFKVQESMPENTEVIAGYKWYQLINQQKNSFNNLLKKM